MVHIISELETPAMEIVVAVTWYSIKHHVQGLLGIVTCQLAGLKTLSVIHKKVSLS